MSIVRFLKDWNHANNLEDSLSIPNKSLPLKLSKEVWWNKPLRNVYKLNFDGSKVMK